MLYKISFRQEDKQLVREKRKSAITILLMNLPHFVTSACILTSIVSPGGISWFDINFIFCPILTATLNPLLIVTRSAAVKQFIRDKLHLQLEKLTKVYRGPIIKMDIKGPRKQLKATKSISVPATGATFKNASYMTSVWDTDCMSMLVSVMLWLLTMLVLYWTTPGLLFTELNLCEPKQAKTNETIENWTEPNRTAEPNQNEPNLTAVLEAINLKCTWQIKN